MTVVVDDVVVGSGVVDVDVLVDVDVTTVVDVIVDVVAVDDTVDDTVDVVTVVVCVSVDVVLVATSAQQLTLKRGTVSVGSLQTKLTVVSLVPKTAVRYPTSSSTRPSAHVDAVHSSSPAYPPVPPAHRTLHDTSISYTLAILCDGT